jgi:hypothetical protein
MKVRMNKSTGRVFEYFLYVVMILETGMAAFVYKLSTPETALYPLRIYLALFYFSFLGWCIFQLNRLHVRRKALESEVKPVQAAAIPEVSADVPPQAETAAPAVTPVAEAQPAGRLVLGLSGAQLMVVLVAFLTAIVTFNWVLGRVLASNR